MLQPLAAPLLKRRLAKGKEDPARWREKLGEASAPRPDGPLVWMHGVGVGEVMALRGLIDAMSAARPDLNFLVTSSARSSGEVFAKNLPDRTRHQYLPFDLPRPAAAFLGHWRPDLVVWSDQEIWPRLAVETARRGVAQALVAARITDASSAAKAKFGQAYGDLYRLLDLHHAQDDKTAAHLAALMGDDASVQVTGSLKAAAAPLRDDPILRARFDAVTRPIWLLAPAHRTDIDIALKAQLIAATDHNHPTLLIIAPRQMADADYIASACHDQGLTTAQRSAGTLPDATTDVFIADTFGELGNWYRVASTALIGGTFDATEGHNPWEGAALGCAILHGPKVANFQADYDRLTAAQAARLVNTPDDIAAALTDASLRDMAKRATQTRADAQKGIAQITADLLGLLDA